jgi:hypothetical protein
MLYSSSFEYVYVFSFSFVGYCYIHVYEFKDLNEPCNNFHVCFLCLNHIVAYSLIRLFIRSFVCCMSHFVPVYVT